MNNKYFYKSILILILSIGIFSSVNAASNNNDKFSQLIKQEFQNQTIFWNKMKTCSIYSATYNDVSYKIVGKTNNACHVKMGSLDCKFTGTSAQKYANINLNYGKRIISDIDSNRGFSISTNDPESVAINQMRSSYCKIEF